MADSPEVEAFIATCERRLRCLYARPDCTGTFPAATHLTRYLFPTSLDAIGVRAPNAVVELLLVARTSPRWFWEEVDDVFADGAYRVSVVKSMTHPMSSMATLPSSRPAVERSVLRVEVNGRLIVLEYCPHERIEELVDSNGRFPSTPVPGHHLGRRAHYIQQAASSPLAEIRRETATRHLHLAHNSGLLSKRLGLLTSEQVFEKSNGNDSSDLESSLSLLWDELATV